MGTGEAVASQVGVVSADTAKEATAMVTGMGPATDNNHIDVQYVIRVLQ